MIQQPTADMLLLKIVNDVMKPTGRYKLRSIGALRYAVKRYEEFREGVPQYAREVTRELLDQFIAWSYRGGLTLHSAKKLSRDVATVVRAVDATLLPRFQRRPRSVDGALGEACEPKDWPLVRVVNEIVAATGKRSKRTIVKYRQSCRCYCRFRGAGQRASDVTAATLDEFAKWQVRKGYGERVAEDVAAHVAAVVRCADPSILPKQYRRPAFADARRPAFDDRDADGSLESIMLNQYFPARSSISQPSTEKQYAAAAAKFSLFLGHAATLADLSDLTLGRWMRALRDEGLAAPSINGYLNKIRAFWNWAAKKRLVEMFPTIENAPEPRRIPKAWNLEQMQSLFAACGEMPGTIAGVPAGLWWRALHAVAFDTGERKSALLALRWDNFDPATGDLEAPAEIRKGRKKPMIYRLRPAAVAALEAIQTPEREIIFAWDAVGTSFHLRYKALLTLAGLPYEKHRSGIQKVRRSFASFIEAAGGNATAALDHTARKVTVNSYLDPRVVKTPSPNLLLPHLEAIKEGGAV